MCQHVVFLAERAGQRYISQCEHGTVHFVWDGVGFHLPAAAFLQLAYRLVESKAAYAEATPTRQEHFYLQVGRTLVALPWEYFPFVIEMIEEALPRVNQRSQVELAPPRLTFPTKRRAVVLN